MTGTISHLVRARGFGFIKNGVALEYFFHASEAGSDWPWLQEGSSVSFEAVPKADSPRGPRAIAVKLLTYNVIF